MGVSTNAILAYGVQLSDYDECQYEDLPWAEPDDEDFDSTLARLAGAPSYPDEGWLEAKRAAVEACPLELVTHCHLDVPCWILAIKGTVTEAYRGYPEQIDNLDAGDHVAEQHLLEFLSKHGIEGSPEW